MDNKKLIIIAGILFVIVIVVVLALVFGGGTERPERVVLEFWGVFDDSGAFEDSISQYERMRPNVDVVYRAFSFEDYERSLISALAAGSGPDIFMIHNTWLPKHQDKIAPLPQERQSGDDQPLLTFRQFQDSFVDVAVKDLTQGGRIYGLPLYVDTLALYYNKNVFASEGIAVPPRTWNEFNDVVRQVTDFDNQGNIARSGAAIGTSRNVNRSTDILSLLMLQSGTRMVNEERTQATFADLIQGQNVGETALQYYTDFANPTKQVYTWNDDLFFSIDAFFTGQTVMMFNYSHHVQTLKDKSQRFDFGVASMPQIEGTEDLNYANYWAPTVSEASEAPVESWRFLVHLSSRDGAIPYLLATQRPVARRDLVAEQSVDPDLGVFADQVLSATSWYQIDSAAIETIFADMIDDINFNRASLRDAIRNAQTKITLLMRQ